MSKIQVNEIVNHFDNGAPDCPRGLTVTGVSTFSGNVSIGGTLTYEDVTNIDSVGVITARDGLDTPTDLVLRTGGTEQVRIDSSGRLLVGTTTAGTTAADDLTISTSGDTGITIRSGTSNSGSLMFADGTSGSASYRAGISYYHSSDHMAFTTNGGFERMRIDSSGNVGINTSSPSQALHNAGPGAITLTSGNAPQYRLVPAADAADTDDSKRAIFGLATADTNFFGTAVSGDAALRSPSSGNLLFGNGQTERMRIDSSGRLLVGTTNTTQAHTIQGFGATNCAWFQANTPTSEVVAVYGGTATGDNIFIKFLTDNLLTRGSIDYNRSAGQVRYNTTSDARLKSEIADSTTALSTLNNIRVRKYKWTETDYQVEHGFVAQELTGVVPEAVKVGDDGDEVVDIWAVDNSKLVPLLTKALQEAIAKIETLEVEVQALKGN